MRYHMNLISFRRWRCRGKKISHVIILTMLIFNLTFNRASSSYSYAFFKRFYLQELKESFNYGLFCPPSNGKAGKFLDEERRLGDYPFNGPVGYLEVRMRNKIIKTFLPAGASAKFRLILIYAH